MQLHGKCYSCCVCKRPGVGDDKNAYLSSLQNNKNGKIWAPSALLKDKMLSASWPHWGSTLRHHYRFMLCECGTTLYIFHIQLLCHRPPRPFHIFYIFYKYRRCKNVRVSWPTTWNVALTLTLKLNINLNYKPNPNRTMSMSYSLATYVRPDRAIPGYSRLFSQIFH